MQFIQQLFVLTLSTLVILFSGGALVGSHFCNGKVVSKSFSLEIKKCKKDKADVTFTKLPIVSKISCCGTRVSFMKFSVSEKFELQKEQIVYKQALAVVQKKQPPHTVELIKKIKATPKWSVHTQTSF